MNPWVWVDPRVKDIRAEALRRYLADRCWKEQPAPRPNVLSFVSPTGIPLVLPGTEGEEFHHSIVYFLTTLSEIEGRHPDMIVEDILTPNGERR
jgi:hypothetical protein